MFNKLDKVNTLEVRTLIEYVSGKEIKREGGFTAMRSLPSADFTGSDYKADPEDLINYLNTNYKKQMQKKGLHNKPVGVVFRAVSSWLDDLQHKQAQ